MWRQLLFGRGLDVPRERMQNARGFGEFVQKTTKKQNNSLMFPYNNGHSSNHWTYYCGNHIALGNIDIFIPWFVFLLFSLQLGIGIHFSLRKKIVFIEKSSKTIDIIVLQIEWNPTYSSLYFFSASLSWLPLNVQSSPLSPYFNCSFKYGISKCRSVPYFRIPIFTHPSPFQIVNYYPLFSKLVCCQPTELILGFVCFIIFTPT